MYNDSEHQRQDREIQQFRREYALDNVSEFCAVAENTANPLFLWKALSAWFDANSANQKLGIELTELPEQIQTYLAVSAKRLNDLSKGFDYRQAPEPVGDLPRVWESVEIARKRKPTLSTARATTLALHALGLRQDGRNAFGRAMALAEQDIDALSQEMYVSVGDMGDGESMQALLDDHEATTPTQHGSSQMVETERGLRKRIKASRDARRSK